MDRFLKLTLFFIALWAVTTATITHMCDFEMDDCDYMNDETDDYDWKRRRLITGGILSGPLGDHTTGLGTFMYADASDGKSNSVARVMTPVLEGSTALPSSLLTFWFSMWSLNPLEMGTLNVYVRYNGVMNPIPVWSTSGVQNSITEWLEAKVLVTSVAEYQIVFESVRGLGPRSDIAIDDISVINAAIPATCDLEDSAFGPLCVFYQELIEDDFDWTWQTGTTPTLDTGPISDHTYANESGHYLYIETSRDDREVLAQLKSYPMYKDGGACSLTFWFHAFGTDLGAIGNTPISVVINGDVSNIAASRTSDPEWREASVSLQGISGTYQIIIEGRRRNGNQGDVAIDDISIGGNCIDIDKCASNPCWNGGSCTQTASMFVCECVPGYTGLNCQFDVDECESSPCEEPRVCVDRLNRYECICEGGFTGENCDIPDDEAQATEVVPVNSYRQPVIIGASTMAGGVILITLLIACCCSGSGKGGSSISSGSIQNPPTAKELAMQNMSSDNSAFEADDGRSDD
ncbi:putative MAM and LDL-receptor class A domain-containing protein 1 [Apostichopus japonicus]|uniref:Putative MAM and LDL-receptor class A domain-containing protein 1 n=1 Tax=Stichopus japonicus TaxID=307972 RepID=A0A2G8L231_STIJA|nr:putative MAM and LDL-receptor class A domain-containing protein 1 [Apostichopus japonicus]